MRNTTLKNKIRKIILEEDPMGIYFLEDINVDEYDREIDMIMERLFLCKKEIELLEEIRQIFVSQFSETSAGSKEKFERISRDIWYLKKEFKVN